jgi:glutathione peroxidase
MDEYGSRGLKVLAFPCNQFGKQEPGTPEEIMAFVKTFDPNMLEKLNFFEKQDVNGANAREVFSFLKKALPAEDGTTDVRWNFSKYIFARTTDCFWKLYCLKL